MNKLVFIVEDDPVHQKMLEVHFAELGNYAVRTYTNPEDMMNHLHEKPFAIVLDHFFGVRKTGLDYLKELKKKKLGIPVIYYSTLTDPSIIAEIEGLGVERFIQKDSASLVRLRTALDTLNERLSRKGFFSKLFGK
jgi:two-component system OmpR family response regulator